MPKKRKILPIDSYHTAVAILGALQDSPQGREIAARIRSYLDTPGRSTTFYRPPLIPIELNLTAVTDSALRTIAEMLDSGKSAPKRKRR